MSRLLYLTRVVMVLLGHYRRHPGQAAFMALGLITGVALWCAVQLLNDHARASYADADRLLGAEARYWIRGRDGEGVAPEDYIRLRRAGFTGIYPVIERRARTAADGFVAVIATDLLALPEARIGGRGGSANPFAAEAWLPLIQPPFEAWYPASYASRLGVAPGERLALANGAALPPAVLQVGEGMGQRAFMDIAGAMATFDTTRFSYLAVAPLPPGDEAMLRGMLPAGLTLTANTQALDLTQLTSSLHVNLSALGLLSFAVGLFIVFNAVRFSLQSRGDTLTSLREMGVGSGALATAIAVEALFWGLFGTGAGVAAGYLLTGLLLPAFAVSLQGLYGATLRDTIEIDQGQWLLAGALTLGGVTLALALPLWHRARQTVREGRADGVQWAHDARVRRWQALAGAVLLVLAGASYTFIETVMHGFVVLGLVLFGGALLLPSTLQAAIGGSGRIARFGGLSTRWAVSDALAQLPSLRVALMALLLTLTANIGVVSLVGSFRAALGSWLDVRLAADIYVQGTRIDTGALLAADTSGWLRFAHARTSVPTRFAGAPAAIRGVDPKAPDARAAAFPLLTPQALRQWAQGAVGAELPTILANEQVRYLAGIEAGETITLETASGPRGYRVGGFFHDYGSARYQFYLPRSEVERHWPGARVDGLALWVFAGAHARADEALLAAGARPGDWVRQGEIRRVSFAIFDRTFAITSAINTLTLVVVAIALLAALMAIHDRRLPEYVRWRALGVRFSEWVAIVGAPLVVLVLVTCVAALPLGAALAWLLIHHLNVVSFGWTMPLLWEWGPIARLGGLTLAITVGVLCVTALRVRMILPHATRQLARGVA